MKQLLPIFALSLIAGTALAQDTLTPTEKALNEIEREISEPSPVLGTSVPQARILCAQDFPLAAEARAYRRAAEVVRGMSVSANCQGTCLIQNRIADQAYEVSADILTFIANQLEAEAKK